MKDKASLALIDLLQEERGNLFGAPEFESDDETVDGRHPWVSLQPDLLEQLHDCLENEDDLTRWVQVASGNKNVLRTLCKLSDPEEVMAIASATDSGDEETSLILLSGGHYDQARESRGWVSIADERVELEYFDGETIRRTTSMDRATQLELCAMFQRHGVVGNSAAMVAVYEKAVQITQHSAAPPTVLIYGDPGSGKSLFADALHHVSGRTGGYGHLGVAERPPDLFDDAINGHMKGAYTGADRDQMGIFEQNLGGTVILEDMNRIDSRCCPKLLTVLQNRRVRRIGGSEDVDVRDAMIVVTANERLEDVENFPADLRQRLDTGLVIHVPPLASRATDVPLLVKRYLSGRTSEPIWRFRLPIAMVFERLANAGKLTVRAMENRIRRLIAESVSVDLQSLREGEHSDSSVENEIMDAVEKMRLEGNRIWTKKELARRLGCSPSTLSTPDSTYCKAFTKLQRKECLPEFEI